MRYILIPREGKKIENISLVGRVLIVVYDVLTYRSQIVAAINIVAD